MKVRLKEVKVAQEIPETEQKLVKVVLEDDEGYTDGFVIDLWEMLDEERFAEILVNWRDNILPKRKMVKNILLQEAKQIEELTGLEIDESDDKENIKLKIKDVIDKVKKQKS